MSRTRNRKRGRKTCNATSGNDELHVRSKSTMTTCPAVTTWSSRASPMAPTCPATAVSSRSLLSDDFTFYSPPDPGIDRGKYFERCWPNSDLIESFEFKRLVENGDEVIVTYESTKTDGKRLRNTEVLTFEGDKICKTEVYFGWDLE